MAKQTAPFGQIHQVARSRVYSGGRGISQRLYDHALALANKTGKPVVLARGTIYPSNYNATSGNGDGGSGGGSGSTTGSIRLPSTQEEAARMALEDNARREGIVNNLFDQMLESLGVMGQTRRTEIDDAASRQQGQLTQDLINRGLYNTTTGAQIPTFVESQRQREITALGESLAQQRIGILGERAGFNERIISQAPSLTDFFNQQAAAAAAPTSIPGPSSGAQQAANTATGNTKLTYQQRKDNFNALLAQTTDPQARVNLLSSSEGIYVLGTNQRLTMLNQARAALRNQTQQTSDQSPVAPAAPRDSTLYVAYNRVTGERRNVSQTQFNSLARSNSNWINQGPVNALTTYG